MSTPAGWYADPDDPNRQRYWNGAAWTENRTEPAAAPAPPAPPVATTTMPAAVATPNHTTRNVILIIIAVLILLVGGCTVALVVAGGSAVNNAIDEIEQSDNAPGGPNNPLEIQIGEPFEVQGFNYQSGWTVTNSSFGLEIKNLKVENNRDDKDSAIVEIKFLKGNEVLALADCITDPIDPGQIVTVHCISTDKLPANYDTITINDTF
jgi:hypothetical protein